MSVDILTAISPAESERLVELARGRRVIEVGAQWGYSTVLLAQVAELVVSIDHHRGDQHAGYFDTLPVLLANLDRYGVRDKVLPVLADWRVALQVLGGPLYDPWVIFLDAEHDTASVAEQLDMLRTWDVPIAIHDYHRFGVTEAVDAAVAKEGYWLEVVDYLAVLTRR